MMVPLSRDQHNNPFELPEDAVYWRVRRHTGGRPSTVLGPDKSPLFVAVACDKPELRAYGCNGSLRLEPVNGDFRTVDAPVAFVELGSDGDETTSVRAPAENGNTDLVRVGFESLTRTVEAMQRAQVERERANAVERKAFADAQIASQRMNTELVIALAERVGGGKPQDALSTMKEHAAIERMLAQRNGGALPEPLVAAEDSGLPKWLHGLLPYVPMAVDSVVKIVGRNDEKKAEEIRRNAQPYVQAAGALQAGAPQLARYTNDVEDGSPLVAASVDDEGEDRPLPPKAIREVLARFDDEEAEALHDRLDDLDDDELAELGRQASAIGDMDSRVAWARALINCADRNDENESADWRTAPVVGSAHALDIPPALIPVLARLTPDEQAAGAQLLSVLDRASIEKLSDKLLAMTPDRALASIRRAITNARQRGASVAHRAINAALAEEEGVAS